MVLAAMLSAVGPGRQADALQNCPCTTWSAGTTPGNIDSGDPSDNEVGLKFETYDAGYITGVRFYKAATNTGAHTGHLWDYKGNLVASVNFTGETASGWQEADFATPVLVQANTYYTVSYSDPGGHYSYDHNIYTAPQDVLPYHLPANAGVFTYSVGTYPTSTFMSNSYYVDAVFTYSQSTVTSNAAVDPALTFTVSGHAGACNGVAQSSGVTSNSTNVVMPHISATSNVVAAQDLEVVTNAANGFTVYTHDTGSPSDGRGHTIADVSGTNASPAAFPSAGTAAFGYTTSESALGTGTANRFTSPSAQWAKFTPSDAEVSYYAGPVDHTVCVGYQIGAAPTSAAGAYSTGVVFTAVPSF